MDVPYELLLHPELLSNEQLIHIIQERQLRIPNLERMPRDDLLELFHNYCVPYGQRKYRDSGRGKILNKSRHLSPELAINLNTMTNNQSSRKLHSNIDRAKPPPDLLSGHMKRIKLEGITTPTKSIYPVVVSTKPVYKDNSSSKRKMSIDMTVPQESPPPKKDRKPITWP